MRIPALIAAFLLLPVAASAQLQVQGPPVGFSGALVSSADTSVTLKDKDGKLFEVAMTPGWTASTLRSLDAGAIKPGNFIASANTIVDANTGRSTELRILEAGYRPEYGTHLMAQQSSTAMTHGTVATATPGADGVTLVVTYPGGTRNLIVPTGVKITGYDVVDRSLLKAGTQVSSVTRKGPDGIPRAGRLLLAP